VEVLVQCLQEAAQQQGKQTPAVAVGVQMAMLLVWAEAVVGVY
jgi:hypothetical protein